MSMNQVTITIEGKTPLLMNRFTAEAELELNQGHRPTTKKKYTPREEAERSAYIDNKSKKLYLPTQNILACLIEAGKFFKLGKNKVTTTSGTLLTGGVTIEGMTCSLGTKKFEVDSRRVVNPSTRGAVLRHRARVDKWKTTFHLEVDDEIFSVDLIREIVDAAGKRIGLGDFRPSKKGVFGKFRVVGWDVEGDDKPKVA
jgi:hypothetical protein